MKTNQQLLEAIVSYAENNCSITNLILIGSQARKENKADEYSDLDLVMITDNPEQFLLADEWLSDIGNFHMSFIEPTISGHKERRVMFDNALDVDFIILSQEQAMPAIQSEQGLAVFGNGYQLLVNKNLLTLPCLETNQKPAGLSEDVFINVVNDFWYHTIWTTKKLLRNELWAAKFCVDSYMKWKLLWIIEQYERVRHGSKYNTWYGGRFIDRWAEPEIKDHLTKTFAHYDAADMSSALMETMNLFRRLAVEVSAAYGFTYPFHADEYATNWVCLRLERKTGKT